MLSDVKHNNRNRNQSYLAASLGLIPYKVSCAV